MTSIALIPQKIEVKTPFAVICSFEVPTTDPNPDCYPSVSVCMGKYETMEQAKQAFLTIKHPALIAAWCHQSMRDEDY